MTTILRRLSAGREPGRRLRRALVILGAFSIPATAAFVHARPPGLDLVLSIAVLALLGAPLVAISLFRRDPFRRKDVDERERQRRDEAYRISYRILQLALAVGFIVVGILVLFAGSWIDEAWGWLTVTTLWYVVFLPYLVFAWREPDSLD